MIGLDDPCPNGTPENAISLGSQITVQQGGGVSCFFNGDPTHYITDLTVEAANVGFFSALLDQTTLDNTFNCQALNGNFFQGCAVSYDGNNLFFHFSTTNKNASNTDPDPTEEPNPNDPELGPTEQEGIPTLGSDCGSEDLSCLSRGHFLFTLNDGFTETNTCTGDCTQLGSWNTYIPNGGALITEELNGVQLPEPSTVLPLGLSLLFAGGFSRRFLRRRRS